MARTAIVAHKAWGLNAIPSHNGIEVVSSSWTRGAPLIDSSGKLAVAGTDPRAILGFATEAASGVTDKVRRFTPALPNVIFEASLDKASALGLVSLQTHMYAEFGITLLSGVWYIDVDKVTGGGNTVFRIVGFKDPVGTISARVFAVMLHEVSVLHT
jgi:hypothetical protein